MQTVKTFGAAVLTVLSLSAASAQDKITTVRGETMEVKVEEVGPKIIRYKKYENQTGPMYSIPKNDVRSIEYENGAEEDFGNRRGPNRKERFSPAREDASYGRNILSLAVLQMTNESAAGMGIHYERMLDKRGIISLYVPVALSFVRNNDYYYGPNPPTNDRSRSVYTTVFPGLKIYPTGSQGVIRYSVGPSLGFGFGEKWINKDYYNGSQWINERVKENVFKSGIMVNNGLNIQPTKNLYLGLELGLGFYYVDQENDYNNYNSGEPMVQFNFKMGYRF